MSQIVLVEDDPDDIYVFQKVFAKISTTENLTILNNGQELIDYVTSNDYSNTVFLLDINMPILNGFDTLKALEEKNLLNSMVVIAFTTSQDDATIELCYDLGVSGYVTKTNSITGLEQLLNSLKKYWFDFNQFPKAKRHVS